MILIIILVIGLAAWSLRLMQQALQEQEFSLMLAGTLVAMAAAAMLGVYFLMGNYVVYLQEMGQQSASLSEYPDPMTSVSINWNEYEDAIDRAMLTASPVVH